jgi:hypothetical protein
MSSTTILYEWQFIGSYSEEIFAASPYASDTIRPKVQAAVVTEQRFLQRFPGVNKIAQQIVNNGQYFKVQLTRS